MLSEEATRRPSAQEVADNLLPERQVSSDILSPPKTWAPMADPLQAVLVELPVGPERAEVIRLFRQTVAPSVRVTSVGCVQNLSMWQSFAVKRQTVSMRDRSVPVATAAARYERLQRDCNVFLEQHGLSPSLRERVRDHLDRSHLRVKRRSCDTAAEARGHGRVDESTILEALSPLLRSEVCIERCRRVIRASPLLNGTLVRSDIARAAAPFLSPLSIGEGEAVLERTNQL